MRRLFNLYNNNELYTEEFLYKGATEECYKTLQREYSLFFALKRCTNP